MFKIRKIIVADDHPLFREALQQAILNSFGELEIINCGSFSALQKLIYTHSDSDLVLLDLHMPGAVGFSALHYLGISHPRVPVVIISANEEAEIISRSLKHGALGFIPKSSPIETIIGAMEHIIAGNIWLPDDFNYDLAGAKADDKEFAERLATLTPKQFRVLMMLIEGKTNSEISQESYVTVATIKAHLSEIFKKLAVNNRTQAAMKAATYLEVDNPDTMVFK